MLIPEEKSGSIPENLESFIETVELKDKASLSHRNNE
jgi:hypothetical protein